MSHSPGSGALLQLDELCVGYGGRALLPALSLRIDRGDQWALLGPNGAGKTTLLKCLLGLLPPISGTARLEPGLTVGYVPQQASLNPGVPRRVVDLVRGGVDRDWSFLSPWFARRQRAVVDRAMRDANVATLADQQMATLSEGQKQRALVARALAVNPDLLILDEPTAAMDVEAERDLFELLTRLRQERDLAVMIVSHQLTVAARFATHGILVDKERQHALAGEMRDVACAPATVALYGPMLVDAMTDGV